MRLENPTPALSAKRGVYLLIVCAAALLCGSQLALAQSGRHKRQSVTPPPVNDVPPPQKEIEPPPIEPAVTVSAVLIGGDIVTDADYSRSNYVKLTAKECKNRLMEHPVLEATARGDKLTRKEAVDLAKKERDSYVLWFEIRMKTTNIWGDMIVSYIDYVVFKPQTAEILTEGRVDPNTQGIRHDGDVVRVPSINKRSSIGTIDLLEGARIIADRVRVYFIKQLRAG